MKIHFGSGLLATLALAIVTTLGASPTNAQQSAVRATAAQSASTLVLVVRHAEKASETARDPELSAAGMARAEALRAVAHDAGVTAIITTQFLRTQATAARVAAERHLTPEIVRASASVSEHARAVADAARRHAGGVVLIVGHSNTVPAIVAAFGAPEPPVICDSEYDNLYLVMLTPDAPARLVRSRYGEPSVAAPDCARMSGR
jgi:phosphohistidine phosphatase SixA